MDLKDLRSRIDAIQQNAAKKPGAVHREKPDISRVLTDNGWNRTDDMVFEKITVRKNILPDTVSDVLLDARTPSTRLIFYDTETTGLSGGAGNIVFLAGFGEPLPGSGDFRITQLFLSDFPGEPSFLKHLKDFIRTDRIYVSYNGKSFDANILNSRFAMNGIKAEFGYQLDLLYTSRRLWKNIIGSCSLGDIESRVLDKRRNLDVPGFMVPELYFDFIRSGKWESIEGVMAHHLEDIYSLAELLAVHEQLFNEAGSIEDTGFADQLGLAMLMFNKAPAASEALLMRCFNNGNKKAGMELSLIFKRSERWAESAEIWKKLWTGSRSVFAGTELAKYYEHRLFDHRAALDITNGMLGLERFRIQNCAADLEKRRKRLEKKLSIGSG